MASGNIKKNIILKKDLPSLTADNENLSYEIRYRVVSEDKNRLSHWSPINKIILNNTGDETGFDPNNPNGTNIPHQVIVTKSRHTAECSWTMPALLIVNPTEEQKILQAQQAAIKEFDVYVKWETSSVWSDWIWVGTSNGSQFSINYAHGNGSPDHIMFRVQKITSVKNAFDSATYLVSNEYEL